MTKGNGSRIKGRKVEELTAKILQFFIFKDRHHAFPEDKGSLISYFTGFLSCSKIAGFSSVDTS